MLLELHDALRLLLYRYGQISPREVDISFETPTDDYIETLIRPTISLFLFDVHENTSLRQHNFQNTVQNGRMERRVVPRRFNLCFMVSVLTTVVEDEHLLLWRVLLTLLQHPRLPADVLSETVGSVDPPLITSVAQTEDTQRLTDLWMNLGSTPHPALSYMVTVPVDLNLVINTPLVLHRTVRYARKYAAAVPPEPVQQIGGIVRNADGDALAGVTVTLDGHATPAGVTDAEGRFILRNVPTGNIMLRATSMQGASIVVPRVVPEPLSGNGMADGDGSFDIVLDAAPTSEAAQEGVE